RWLADPLLACPPCTARKDSILAQGNAIRERASARADEADLSGVADAVIARIDREAPRLAAPPLSVWGAEMWGAHRAALSASAGVALAGCLALARSEERRVGKGG